MLAPNENSARLFRPHTTIDADGTVEGYASLFGEIDQARDMVMPGAFADTLRLRGVHRVPMLFQHDPAEPVGIWLELREDGRGLYARGKLIPEVQRGRELLALLRQGAIDGLSIGFRTASARVDPKSRIRRVYHVDLWEISIVTFPLLAGARIQAVKESRLPYRVSVRKHDGEDERLLRKFPRVSFQRNAAERAWRGIVAPGNTVAARVRARTINEFRPLRSDRIRG